MLSRIGLNRCLAIFILDDPGMRENDMQGIYNRVSMVFKNKMYLRNLKSRDVNWLGEDIDVVLKGILEYIKALI